MYWKYALRRTFHVVITYVIITFILSALFNAVMDKTQRTDIRERVQGEVMAKSSRMTPAALAAYRDTRMKTLIKQYHLDQPTAFRIFWNAIRTLSFDFGNATNIRASNGEKKVLTIIAEAMPRTVMLFTLAVLIDIIIGVLIGIKQAQKPGKPFDRGATLLTMVVYGLPTWWFAMVLIMLLVYKIGIFPSGGLHTVPPPEGFAYYLDLLYHMALPVLTLVAVGFWARAYLTRNIVLGTLQEDYIMSARARGLPERKVLYGHTMRSAAPPIVTMAALSILFSIGGGLIFEGIFSWPGMGNLYWIGVQQNDIPVLMGNLAVTILFYLAGILVLDLIYGLLDPRIKVGGKA